jgi:hypothetical protein
MNKDQTPTVRGANSLDAITTELRDLRTKDVHSMLRAGELLIAAKTQHATAGTSFTRWLDTEFAWSERTAQDWMLAARWHHNLDDKSRSNCGGLSRTAVIRLAKYDQQDPEENAQGIEAVLSVAGKRSVGASEVEEIIDTGWRVEDFDTDGNLIERAAEVESASIVPGEVAAAAWLEGEKAGAVTIETPAEMDAAEREYKKSSEYEDEYETDNGPEETGLSEAVRFICEVGVDAPLGSLAALDSTDVGRAAFILGELAVRLNKQEERERVKEIADRAEARAAGAVTTTYCTIDYDEPGNVPRELCTVCRRIEKAKAS